MNPKSAKLLLAQKTEIRAIGDPCDASCTFWFACANSGTTGESGVCKGFFLLNGKTREHLKGLIGEDNLQYIINSHAFIERSLAKGYTEPVNVVLRSVDGVRELAEQRGYKRPELKLGFKAMLNEAFREELTEQRSFPPNLEEDYRKVTYPAICTELCPFKTCPYNRFENYGEPCKQQWEQYSNEKFHKEVVRP